MSSGPINQPYGCIKCHSLSHITSNCPEPKPINPIGCSWCQQKDHFTDICPLLNDPMNDIEEKSYKLYEKANAEEIDFHRANEDYESPYMY